MSRIPELTPAEYVQRWPLDRQHEGVVLLDVREAHELAIASLDFVRHIPMGQIPTALDSLDKNKTLVVMCHGGGRSLRVAEFLAGNGFTDVYNLSGGIDAWSREIDSNVPRY